MNQKRLHNRRGRRAQSDRRAKEEEEGGQLLHLVRLRTGVDVHAGTVQAFRFNLFHREQNLFSVSNKAKPTCSLSDFQMQHF